MTDADRRVAAEAARDALQHELQETRLRASKTLDALCHAKDDLAIQRAATEAAEAERAALQQQLELQQQFTLSAEKQYLELKAASARLRASLQQLVEKLDVIHADPRYEAVWTLYHVHGGRYAGPDYSEEVSAAKQVLREGAPPPAEEP